MPDARWGLLLAGLLVAGCHSSTSPTATTTTTTTTTDAATFSLSVSGAPVLTGLRQRSQMNALVTNADGTTQDVTHTAAWLTSDASVATITSSGVVTSIAPGTTHLTAVYQTTTQGFDLAVSPVTTTFTGPLTANNGATGTFVITVHGSTDVAPGQVSAPVSGALQIQDATITLSGFFESSTGAFTLTGAEAPYRLSGTVADRILNATFTASDDVTGSIASTSTSVS